MRRMDPPLTTYARTVRLDFFAHPIIIEQAMQQEKVTSGICLTIFFLSRNKKRRKALLQWLAST
jgi:hypothetical protein